MQISLQVQGQSKWHTSICEEPTPYGVSVEEGQRRKGGLVSNRILICWDPTLLIQGSGSLPTRETSKTLSGVPGPPTEGEGFQGMVSGRSLQPTTRTSRVPERGAGSWGGLHLGQDKGCRCSGHVQK